MAMPQPRPIPSAPALRWGVLGTGWIADKFTHALHTHSDQRVVAVGSRSEESARAFAQPRGIERVHASYDALVADSEVDVVYVATPHNHHVVDALRAIEAGKHVLIEKPVALDAAETRRIAGAARTAGVFAMEALWTLFLPRYDVLRQLLDDGALGDVMTVQADIGEWFEPDHRIFDRALAGGCMLDMATYPITFSQFVAGVPEQVEAVGTRGPGGVVSRTTMAFRSASGVESGLLASIDGHTAETAVIAGTQGRVGLEGPFYQPGPVTLLRRDGSSEQYDEPRIAHEGLYHQADHVAWCVAQGLTESPVRSLDDSLAFMETMDRVRACTGDEFDPEARQA